MCSLFVDIVLLYKVLMFLLIKFLNFMKPMNLYSKVEFACKNLLCLETGSTGVGISVVDPTTNALPFHVPVINCCESNVWLSPFETAL